MYHTAKTLSHRPSCSFFVSLFFFLPSSFLFLHFIQVCQGISIGENGRLRAEWRCQERVRCSDRTFETYFEGSFGLWRNSEKSSARDCGKFWIRAEAFLSPFVRSIFAKDLTPRVSNDSSFERESRRSRSVYSSSVSSRVASKTKEFTLDGNNDINISRFPPVSTYSDVYDKPFASAINISYSTLLNATARIYRQLFITLLPPFACCYLAYSTALFIPLSKQRRKKLKTHSRSSELFSLRKYKARSKTSSVEENLSTRHFSRIMTSRSTDF